MSAWWLAPAKTKPAKQATVAASGLEWTNPCAKSAADADAPPATIARCCHVLFRCGFSSTTNCVPPYDTVCALCVLVAVLS